MVLGLAAVMVAMLMGLSPALAQVAFEEPPAGLSEEEADLWREYWYGIEPFDARIEPFDAQRYAECQYWSPDVVGYEDYCL
jgi:hypothetical protein